VLKKLLAKKKFKMSDIGIAELKITVILIIALALGVVGLVTYTFADGVAFSTSAEYVVCVSNGGSNCSLGRLGVFNYTTPIIVLLLALLPMASILLMFDFQSCKKKLKTKFGGPAKNLSKINNLKA